ncbi:MAG: hypothetical protein V3W44_08625 [Dehalococcoidales bacterium]
MADNAELNLGSGGKFIGTDEIAGVDYQRIKLITGVDGVNDGDVADSNPFPVNAINVISTDNSSIATLGVSGVFTGPGEDVSQYASVTVQVDASHDSAVDGMTFQFSTNNSDWDDVYPFSYVAADGARRFQFPATAQYFRVVYTNGGTGQTHFRLQTILHSAPVTASVHRIGDDMDPDRSATLVKAVLAAQAAGSGDFTPIDATAAGNLKISVQEFSDGVDVGVGAVGTETLRVVLANNEALPPGDNNIGNMDIVTGPTGASALEVQGTVAIDSPVVGDPIYIGARANANEPTPVDDGDLVPAWLDPFGRLVTIEGHPTLAIDTQILTLASQVDLIAAPGPGISIYVKLITVSNTHATIATRVDVFEGATIEGYTFMLAALGGGAVVPIAGPGWQLAANTALTGELGTALTDVRVTIQYYLAP